MAMIVRHRRRQVQGLMGVMKERQDKWWPLTCCLRWLRISLTSSDWLHRWVTNTSPKQTWNHHIREHFKGDTHLSVEVTQSLTLAALLFQLLSAFSLFVCLFVIWNKRLTNLHPARRYGENNKQRAKTETKHWDGTKRFKVSTRFG